MKNNLALFIRIIVLVCALIATQACTNSHAETDDSNAHNHGAGGDFTLTDYNDQSFSLSQLRGKIVLIFFGYTNCADACPTMLSKLKRVYAELGDKQNQLQAVFVSVDPERDTPAVLKDYLKFFSINAIGLTGKKDDIDKVVKQYGASYEIQQSDSAAGYHVNHSTYLYLIDQNGKLEGQFKHLDSVDTIAAGIRPLLK